MPLTKWAAEYSQWILTKQSNKIIVFHKSNCLLLQSMFLNKYRNATIAQVYNVSIHIVSKQTPWSLIIFSLRKH